MEEDTEGLADLRDCLMTPEVALTTVDLLYNRIGKISSFNGLSVCLFVYNLMHIVCK